jgi:PAS domain S-box-containing protein
MRDLVRHGKRTVSRTLQEIHRDGRRLWVKVTVAPRLDSAGNVKGMLGIGEDVTDQIDALRRSERREREMRLLAFTLDCAHDGFCITDLQQRVLHVNQAFLQIYGYREEELVGRTADLLQARSVTQGQLREITLRTQHGGWSGEVMQRRKSGEEFPADLSTSVVRNDEGEPVALVTVARDVTERRRAEQQIRASLQEKEILLKEIHHRVKNNLQVITSLLNLQSSKEDHPQTAAVLRESQTRIRSMALVHEELYRSRDLSRVDLSSYAGKLASGLFRVFASPASEIGLQIEVRDVFLPVDAAIPCGLILNELISNALKHAFRGSSHGTVTIRMSKRGAAYDLSVQDDGEGLPPYVAVESAESLGFQLVTTLVRQLHGSLEVERTGGTTFHIRFPEPEPGVHG